MRYGLQMKKPEYCGHSIGLTQKTFEVIMTQKEYQQKQLELAVLEAQSDLLIKQATLLTSQIVALRSELETAAVVLEDLS